MLETAVDTPHRHWVFLCFQNWWLYMIWPLCLQGQKKGLEKFFISVMLLLSDIHALKPALAKMLLYLYLSIHPYICTSIHPLSLTGRLVFSQTLDIDKSRKAVNSSLSPFPKLSNQRRIHIHVYTHSCPSRQYC